MSEITTSVVRAVGEKDVIFKELSVADIRKLMAKDSDADAVGDKLFELIRLSDLPDFTSLTAADIESLRPSQIRIAIKYCEAQNPDFFAMLARLHSLLATR